MTKKPDKPEDSKSDRDWTGPAAIAGAAIGSAALAAALLYASRRKDKTTKPTAPPLHPENTPETD